MANDSTKDEKSAAKKLATASRPKRPPKPKLFRVIVRHLPAAMTSEMLMEQLQPLPDFVDYYFMKSDISWLPYSLCRAYFDFMSAADAIEICRRFDGYVFVDATGDESVGIVEWAPSQKSATKRVSKAKTADPNKCGTILDETIYKSFVERTEKNDEIEVNTDPAKLKTVEQMVADVEKRRAQLEANRRGGHTALLDHLATDKTNKLHKRILARQEALRRERVEHDRARRDKKERRQRKRDERRAGKANVRNAQTDGVALKIKTRVDGRDKAEVKKTAESTTSSTKPNKTEQSTASTTGLENRPRAGERKDKEGAAPKRQRNRGDRRPRSGDKRKPVDARPTTTSNEPKTFVKPAKSIRPRPDAQSTTKPASSSTNNPVEGPKRQRPSRNRPDQAVYKARGGGGRVPGAPKPKTHDSAAFPPLGDAS